MRLFSVVVCLFLAGCVSGLDGIELSAPASVADVEALRAHVDSQDASVRGDVTASVEAGASAYEAAIVAGKTELEARAAALEAQVVSAAGSARASEDRAAAAAEAAKEGGVDWEAMILAMLGAVVTAVTGTNIMRNKSRKTLVAAVAAGAGKPAGTPA